MRLSTAVLLSSFLVAGVATRAQAMEFRGLEQGYSNSNLSLFSLEKNTKQDDPCLTEGNKPGCSRRDFPASGVKQTHRSTALFSSEKTERVSAPPPCPTTQTQPEDEDRRGSGRCTA